VSISPRLIDDLVVGRCNPLLNLRLFESIDRVAGDDAPSSTRRFSVEAGGAVAAPDDLEIEIFVRERKHAPVFVERPTHGTT
jgi:hypothetical protein